MLGKILPTTTSAWLQALLRLALLAPLVWVAAAGYSAMQTEHLAYNALLEAALVADAAGSICPLQPSVAQRDLQLTELRAAHPQLATAFVIEEGGADEFGIARGTAVTFGNLTPPQTKLLVDHAKSVTTAAVQALKTGKSLTMEQLSLDLGEGFVAVAVPVRAKAKGSDVSQVAGAVAFPRPPGAPQDDAGALVLAVVFALIGLRGSSQSRTRSEDAVVFASFVGTLLFMMPALASIAGPGVTVLAGDWMVPHGTPPLPVASHWHLLRVALVVGAALLGSTVQPLFQVLRGLRKDPVPYLYVGPAVLATGLLIFVPFALGVGLSFTDKAGHFVGLDHYIEVISSITDPASSTHFGRTFAMTCLWTLLNVGMHVTLGLGLALVLNRPHLRGRALYRLLLIVPWAVPSYITALTWKWLFNTQYGPLNAMLQALGHDRVDWLGTGVASNFAANLATNVWLGFPFMMVISLGALQSIPAELYEAADIDGGSAWQKFRHITLPLLRPALFPAVILGTIWTFNAFNVIWLVSGGGPDHQTDILITEAYYTFTVLRRTGLAAAYSVLIFLILLGYTLVTNRLTKATEAVQA